MLQKRVQAGRGRHRSREKFGGEKSELQRMKTLLTHQQICRLTLLKGVFLKHDWIEQIIKSMRLGCGCVYCLCTGIRSL